MDENKTKSNSMWIYVISFFIGFTIADKIIENGCQVIIKFSVVFTVTLIIYRCIYYINEYIRKKK